MLIALTGIIPRDIAHAAPADAITVNGIGDNVANDGVCTLREAIINANTDSQSGSTDCLAGHGADVINFNLGANSVITLTNGRLPILTSDLTINGSSVAHLTVSGNNTGGVFAILAPAMASVTLVSLNIEKGNAIAGGIDNTSLSGGGIYVFGGDVKLTNVSVANNVGFNGGGIYNNGSLTIFGSTLQGNTGNANGGGVYNSGSLKLINSTVSNNRTVISYAQQGGGGIFNSTQGSVVLSNTTLSSNSSAINGGGIFAATPSTVDVSYATIVNNSAAASGGGIYTLADNVNLQATILANNSVAAGIGPDCGGSGAINSQAYNFIKDSAGCTVRGFDTSSKGVDPMLGVSANYGGSTVTYMPLAGSPVLDRIPYGVLNCGLLATDQREFVRLSGPRCDIGAVEVTFAGPALVVTNESSALIVDAGGTVKFTALVINTGTQPAANVSIRYTLPSEMSVAKSLFRRADAQARSPATPLTDATELEFVTDLAPGQSATAEVWGSVNQKTTKGYPMIGKVSASAPSVATTEAQVIVVTSGTHLGLPIISRSK